MSRLLISIFFLLVFSSSSVMGEDKIVRKLDDFTGLEVVSFKDDVKFETTQGFISLASTWLTPEAALDSTKKVKWIRFHLSLHDVPASPDERRAVGPSLSNNGKMIIKTDNGLIELLAVNQLPDIRTVESNYDIGFIDESLYELTSQQLMSIVQSKTIKVRVIGSNGISADIPAKNYKIQSDWLANMKRFYDDIVLQSNPK